jgi:hypothetical protein
MADDGGFEGNDWLTALERFGDLWRC